MRLTDTDTLMESFEHALGAAPCELNGYEIWEILNAQEPVDAIPVEWLKTQLIDEFYDELIFRWRKEQEAIQ